MAAPTTPIAAGTTAPDFTLKDQNNQDVRLTEFRGKKNVVLLFYPLDWSPVCTPENQCFTKDLPDFTKYNAEVFGVSVDSVWSHKAFAEKYGLKHRLLADMQRTVCKEYGLFLQDANISRRATVIVDKNGTVAWVKVQEDIKQARDDREIIDQLKRLQ
ncbi:MAG: redoxin domain-containing protein [Deltaproteobacteria bacterium]|nr:redoxin domain-containing protein [Deltaproteobacteria bacterium]